MSKALKYAVASSVCLSLIFSSFCRSATVDADYATPQKLAPEAYCGIYAVYAAALAEGVDLNFTSLVSVKYVRCAKGSSLEDLGQAARDQRLYSNAVDGLSFSTLNQIKHPVVLLVRTSAASPNYDHYVTCLGVVNSKVIIVDPSAPKRSLWTEAELLSRWDGIGLVVSEKQLGSIYSGIFAFKAFAETMLCVVILVFGKWYFGSISRVFSLNGRLRGSTTRQCGLIVCLSLVFAVCYQRFASGGLLANLDVTHQVEDAFLPEMIAGVSEGEAKRLIAGEHVTIVDARLTEDYQAGHIEHAVSIPVNVNDDSLKQTCTVIPRTDAILVYCQSSGCPFARTIGAKLIRSGCKDVRVISVGWLGWTIATSD